MHLSKMFHVKFPQFCEINLSQNSGSQGSSPLTNGVMLDKILHLLVPVSSSNEDDKKYLPHRVIKGIDM